MEPQGCEHVRWLAERRMELLGKSDIEGKAVRVAASKLGSDEFQRSGSE